MKLIYILILLVIVSISAQAIEINIYDSDGETLSPIHLKVINAESGDIIFDKMQLDNEFEIELKTLHLMIEVEAPNYAKYFFPLEIKDTDAEININMEALQLNPAAQSAKLLTYSGDCDRLTSYDLPKDKEVFKTTLDESGESVNTTIYRLAKGNDLILPTNAENYIYECGRFYAVLTTLNGKVTVEFDPAKFPAYREVQQVKSNDFLESQIEQLDALTKIELKMTNAYATISSGVQTKITSDDLKPDFNQMEKLIEDAPSDLYKKVTFASYIKISGAAFLTGNSELVKKDLLAKSLDNLDFKSPLWKYYIGSMGVAVAARHLVGEKYSNYFDSLMVSNPYPEVREDFVFQSLVYAYTRGEKDKVRQYYEHLFVFFPESKYISSAKQLMEKIENSMVGETAPVFSIGSLDDSDKTFSNEYFKGKYVFIDFWATWCGPCVREMPHLHDAFEKYKGQIEFMSFSP